MTSRVAYQLVADLQFGELRLPLLHRFREQFALGIENWLVDEWHSVEHRLWWYAADHCDWDVQPIRLGQGELHRPGGCRRVLHTDDDTVANGPAAVSVRAPGDDHWTG